MTQSNETGLKTLEDKFIGCIVGGAIGDGIGEIKTTRYNEMPDQSASRIEESSLRLMEK